MTEIESPLGRRTFSQNSRTVLTVDDHGDDYPEQRTQARGLPSRQSLEDNSARILNEEELQQLELKRKMATSTKSKVSSQARQRIEYLTQIGRIRDSFELDNMKFSMQSLRSGELEEIHDVMVNLGDTTTKAKFNLEMRKQVLARSLYMVDDMPVEDAIGSGTLEAKVDLIDQLDENLVDYMYKFYEEKILKVGRDKYSIKSDEDAKEVVESIKK